MVLVIFPFFHSLYTPLKSTEMSLKYFSSLSATSNAITDEVWEYKSIILLFSVLIILIFLLFSMKIISCASIFPKDKK
jgi:hypothetical protein